jgi:hypothetical protein
VKDPIRLDWATGTEGGREGGRGGGREDTRSGMGEYDDAIKGGGGLYWGGPEDTRWAAFSLTHEQSVYARPLQCPSPMIPLPAFTFPLLQEAPS